MVQVWFGTIEELKHPEIYQACFEKLPDWRKEKAFSIQEETNRLQSVGVWRLWQKIQEIEGISEHHPFNLSHSGGYVLCAYSNQEGGSVGCDIQMMKEYQDRIHQKVLSRKEREDFQKCSKEEQKEWFYRYWVLKESFAKATKKGLAIGVSKIGVDWNQEGEPFYFQKPDGYEESYLCREFVVPRKDARIGVCSKGEEISNNLYEINTFL